MWKTLSHYVFATKIYLVYKNKKIIIYYGKNVIKLVLLHCMQKILFFIGLISFALARSPQKVYVGVYLNNVENIDMSENSYYLNFDLRFKWKGELDPTKSFEFVNTIEEWGLTLLPVYDSVRTSKDGYKYQRFHVEGKFFHKFWLGTFPLDWQKIIFEIKDKFHSQEELVYVADTSVSAVNEDLSIPGWDILKVYNETRSWLAPSIFGEAEKSLVFSKFRFGLKVHRPLRFFFNKVLPPVFVTILCCLLIFSLHVSYVDARVSTAIGALLTEVFLQLSFTANLPNVGIMLLLDHIFNFSYFIIFVILAIIIYTTHLWDKKEKLEEVSEEDSAIIEEQVARLEKRISRIDFFSMLSLSLFFILGVFGITYAIRGYLFY